jgi:hypothetical protein
MSVMFVSLAKNQVEENSDLMERNMVFRSPGRSATFSICGELSKASDQMQTTKAENLAGQSRQGSAEDDIERCTLAVARQTCKGLFCSWTLVAEIRQRREHVFLNGAQTGRSR